MSARKGTAAKAVRKTEAEARLAEWKALSMAEKISVLQIRPGESKKQLAKLQVADVV